MRVPGSLGFVRDYRLKRAFFVHEKPAWFERRIKRSKRVWSRLGVCVAGLVPQMCDSGLLKAANSDDGCQQQKDGDSV